MPIVWNFDANEYEEVSFKPIPAGDHRVRIKETSEKTSSNGNPMIVLKLEVSGYNSFIWYNLVFKSDNPKMTNQKLGEIYNSFGIPQGSLDHSSWCGKVGAAKIKHETYNGEESPQVAYFLSRDKQDKLPVWQEPTSKASGTSSGNFETVDADDDLPF